MTLHFSDDSLIGEPLNELLTLIGVTTLKASRNQDGLVVHHPKFDTYLRLLPPPKVNSEAIWN